MTSEEIIDLEEITEDVVDENLKEFMSKDEETEKLLNEKIEELTKETEKLSKKEEEIKTLEESNREKINSNASADELIEIAGKLKEAEAELSEINENISKLSSEMQELTDTKNDIEKSKIEYIKTLNSTNSSYEEQLRKISEAIEVCDNPTLKQVLEDVRSQKTKELSDLEQKRINELENVLNESKEDTTKEEIKIEEEKNVNTVNLEDKPVLDASVDNNEAENIDNPVSDSFDINIDNTNTVENPVLDSQPIISNINVEPIFSEESNEKENMINIDSILENVKENDLNIVQTDNLVIPEVNQIDAKNENNIKIIYEKDVPDTVLKDIYSSSKIMPSLYDYLNNKNEGSFN